jgi:periplasmic protein CpxP/Spy
MSYAIDQTGRTAIAVGLVGALILLPLTVAAAAGPSGESPRLQFAQAAAPSPTAPAGRPTTAAPAPAPPSATAPPPAASRPGMAGPPAPAGAQGPRDDQLERYLADLHKKLRITPAQEQQFQAFADVMRGNTQAMGAAMRQQEQNPNRNAVEDMRASQQMTEAEAEGLKRLLPAFEALYGGLSDQQKRTADQIMAPAAERNAQPQARPPR